MFETFQNFQKETLKHEAKLFIEVISLNDNLVIISFDTICKLFRV